MPFKNQLCIIVFLIASLLTGCQVALEPTPLPAADTQYWAAMQQKLAAVSSLKIQGRIGYISQQDRGSANFDFDSQDKEFELSLYTSLALQVAKLTQLKDHAELIINNEVKTAASAEELVFNELRLALPASELQKLFLGIPPGTRSYDLQGKITGARFKSYNIAYKDFYLFNGYSIPVELSIRQGGNLIKVKIHKVIELN